MDSSGAQTPPIQFSKAKPVLIAAFFLLIIAVVMMNRSSGSSAQQVAGVLTHLDVVNRLGAVEMVDGPANVKKEVLGEMAPDCEITINGAKAELSDLRVGDNVKVTATRLEEKRPSGAQAIAQRIEVTR